MGVLTTIGVLFAPAFLNMDTMFPKRLLGSYKRGNSAYLSNEGEGARCLYSEICCGLFRRNCCQNVGVKALQTQRLHCKGE